PHEAVEPGIDDGLLEPGPVPPHQWVAALAYLKAAAAARTLAPDRPALVLGADTVVVKGAALIGQPADAADAERLIRLLQDGHHEVISGVALLRTDRPGWRRMFVDRAWVRVGHIGDDAIRAYIAGGNWRGKAGAYNLAERIEAGWPIQYQGDPTTIMGLPMRMLVDRLPRLAGA